MAKMMQATEGFTVATKSGRPRQIPRGTLLPASDKIVKDRPNLFEPLEEVVERATAAPGEKRTAKRPTKKAPKADAAK